MEAVLMLLTAYKSIAYRNQTNRAIIVLARDSILYFVVVFACLASVLALDIPLYITVSVQIPAQCVASIAVGRMMMNIRGLVMGDPEHTAYLTTLQFYPNVQPNVSSTESEDVV
ncbi:hypothetical protein PILCRDRAFT_130120 [Piloderma croceum F 1598]|uniref:Uncharacterized protein n=1 Tax=Piloderma croceum (strain F 1598) TaxID=765440 RepID=A0A0C3GIK6_PILCF|nr:hypothetical protein PILCRDRAFT_130120 [Piloderma croceum F 1598]